jgi:Zn-dependent protease
MLGRLDPPTLLQIAAGLIVAATVHEFAHAYVADRLGDPTPRSQGRLTLNPLAHLDPLGSVLILLVGFGWAKPVQINPSNFRDWRRDSMLVAVAGPLANVTMLFALGVPFKLGLLGFYAPLEQIMLMTIQINAMLAVFNLLPIPPLDGSKILVGLLPPGQAVSYARLTPYGTIILLLLVFTNVLASFIYLPMRWLIAQATGSSFF